MVLASGSGTLLDSLLVACARPGYPGNVVGVVSDKEDALALVKARRAGVPVVTVAPSCFADRGAWNQAMVKALQAFQPDLVVSAGFMRILGPAVLRAFPKIINTHPSLLPAFPGAHAVRDALAAGVAVTGCTVHYIDEGVDTGPIIAQRQIKIAAGISQVALHEQIKTMERSLLVEVVAQLLAAD